MKNKLKGIICILAFAGATTACKDKAKEAETKEAETPVEVKATATQFIVDTDASSIAWTGFKPTESHNGTIKLASGEMNLNSGKLESGSFLADMESIVVLDIPAEKKGNAKLVGHLKDDDFFDVENHKTASFEVTGVSESEGKTMLSGNLAIKGITHNITFPVMVKEEGNKLILESEAFTFDRTMWDIKYASKSFFGDLGDKFIKDDIELKVNIIAEKA